MRTPPEEVGGDAVLLLHGLWLNRLAMSWLSRAIRRSGFTARALTYRSVRAPLAAHLAQLSRCMAELPQRRIHLVGHSLGGVIALRYLQGKLQLPDPRIVRCVLLGAPVAGSSSAGEFARYRGGRWLLGRSIEVWQDRFDTAIDPRFEVGAIAGTAPFGLGRLFARSPSPGDGVVGVEETRLPGLRDHMVIRVSHSGMLISPRVARAVVAFLKQGRFNK